MRQTRRRFYLLPLFLMLACVGLWAQANSEVTGIVTDQTGAVVGGAKVVLTNPATNESYPTVTGGTGLYDINGLNPANYNLKITAKGFETYVQNGIVVNVSSTARVDVKLTVGAEATTVTVEADALAVQADSNVVSTLISSEQISEIATENRNFAALAALGLGVSSALPDSNTPTSVAASFTISVNGLRQSHNIWLIDGGESDDRGGAGGMAIMPSQDGIAEFTMLTSNYPPDYGISSGATMSLSLKSGTQKFHGELWEENRNTDYDSNLFFNKLSTPFTPRTLTHYNIYGAGGGGPIFIPHVYNENKQKTFFYWNEEWRKISNSNGSNTQNTIDPADLPKTGQNLTYVAPLFDPSNTLVVPKVASNSYYATNVLAPLGLNNPPSGPPGNSSGYPITGSPGPGNCFSGTTTWTAVAGSNPTKYTETCTGPQVIPSSLFDSNGVLYLNSGVLPSPNVAGQDKNTTDLSLPIDVRDDIVRIDHKFSDKWAILGHYIHDSVLQGYAEPELGWLWASYNTLTSTLSNPANSAAIKLSGTITPNLLLEASINYDANQINITPSALSAKPAGWTVAPVVSAYAITRNVWPGITGFGGPYGTAEDTGTEPYHNAALDYEPRVDISYTKGKHAMKFGGSLNHYTKNQMLYGDSQGDYGFGNISNDGLMDLLMGLSTSYGQAQSAPIRHYVNNTPSAYVLDNWHLTPRLSLQLGLRFDGLPHAWERNNDVGNFNINHYVASTPPIFDASGAIDAASPDLYTFNGIQSYINGVDLAGQHGTPRGLVSNNYKTLQPRVGFSEDLFGNGKTVLRGGFGTFFEREQGNDIYNAAASAPFDPSLSLGSNEFSHPGTNYNLAAVGGAPVSITPSQLIFAGGMTDMQASYPAPAVAQFSLGVQHEIQPSIIWVIQYVGNIAWHQNIERQLNNMVPGGVGLLPETVNGKTVNIDSRCLSGDGGDNYPGDSNCNAGFQQPGGFNAFRAYPGFAGITQEENTTNGGYNGFQTGVRIQNRWGLSGEADYTWSHEIDITSYDLSGVSDPWDLKYDKASGALDRRQMLNINYIYKLPFLNKGASLLDSIAGGWEIAGTFIDESGVPVVVTGPGGNYDPVGLGGGYTVRPNVSGRMTYNKKMNNYFNTAMFSGVTPSWLGGTSLGFGDAGRDAVVGPGRVNFTTSLYKSFAITDKARFELRFESFNTFNHTEPYGVSTGFDPQNGAFSTVLNHGNTFGQVNSTWDPRNLELGGKFVF